MKRNISRRGFVVLALVALFVVLARPLCDAYHWHGAPQSGPAIAAVHAIGEAPQHGHSELCCASMQDGTLVGSATVVTAAFKSPAAAVPAAVFLPGWRAAPFSLTAPLPPDRAPLLRPYYARSARILI
jgi:hypothetical protein